MSGILLTKLLFSKPDILIYLMMIIVSTIVDIDHVKFLKKAFKSKRFDVQSRSRFHEMFGLLIGLIVLSLLSLLTEIAIPLSIAFSFHYLIDYLTRPTRPFYPFKKEICDFNLYPRSLKGITISDIILTGGLACIIFLLM